MDWLFLLVAGLCETAWAIGLKYTEGFSRLLPTIGTVAAMAASTGFLGLAPLGRCRSVPPMRCGRALAPSALRRSVSTFSMSPRHCSGLPVSASFSRASSG